MAQRVNYGLLILLIATFLKGVTWVLLQPPLTSVDEPQHYLYGRDIAEQRNLIVDSSNVVPMELMGLAQVTQTEYVRFDEETPIDFRDSTAMQRQLSELHSSLIRGKNMHDKDRLLVTQPAFTLYHPPLYYFCLSLIELATHPFSICAKLIFCRLFSALLGTCVVALAYATGILLWPKRRNFALLLSTLVSFHPQFTYTMSSITNLTLETFIFSASLYLLVRVIGNSPALTSPRLGLRELVSLFLLTVAGVLTKVSMLCLLPLIALVVIPGLFSRFALTRLRSAVCLASTLIPGLLIAGWWYFTRIASGARKIYALFPAHIAGETRTFFHNKLLDSCGHAFVTYWAKFGWADTTMPIMVYAVLLAVTLATAAVLIFAVIKTANGGIGKTIGWKAFALSVLIAIASIVFVVFFALLDWYFKFTGGAGYSIRGQYYIPAVTAQMACFVAAVECFHQRIVRLLLPLLTVAGMMMLNYWSLLHILHRFYGYENLRVLIDRAALLQQVSPSVVAAITVTSCIFSAIYLVIFAACSMRHLQNSAV